MVARTNVVKLKGAKVQLEKVVCFRHTIRKSAKLKAVTKMHRQVECVVDMLTIDIKTQAVQE